MTRAQGGSTHRPDVDWQWLDARAPKRLWNAHKVQASGTIGQWGCKGKCACGLCAVSYPCAKAAEVAAVFKTRVQDVDPFIQAWGSTSEEPSFCVA